MEEECSWGDEKRKEIMCERERRGEMRKRLEATSDFESKWKCEVAVDDCQWERNAKKKKGTIVVYNHLLQNWPSLVSSVRSVQPNIAQVQLQCPHPSFLQDLCCRFVKYKSAKECLKLVLLDWFQKFRETVFQDRFHVVCIPKIWILNIPPSVACRTFEALRRSESMTTTALRVLESKQPISSPFWVWL